MNRTLGLGLLLSLIAVGIGFRPGTTGESGGIAIALVAATADTSVVVRRVYEGPRPDFWGTSPSPDGRYVTQTDWPTGDLAVLDLLTGVQRRLTGKKDDGWVTSGAYSEAARFSPDGRRIAYVWWGDGTYSLRVINADGSDMRVVAEAAVNPPGSRSPLEWWPDLHGWSPDGEALLVTLWNFRGGATSLIRVSDGSSTVLHTVQDAVEKRFAALSPDGRFLAFDEGRGREAPDMDVYVLPVDGGEPVRVAEGPSTDLLLGWSPEGGVLFYSDRDLTEGVWRSDLSDGAPLGEPKRLKGDLWGMQSIGVSGSSLFFGVTTEQNRIHVGAIDLEQNRLLGTPSPLEPDMRRSLTARWSPDGTRLAYWVLERERLGQGVNRFMLRSVAGGVTREITPPFRAMNSGFAWSRDGQRLLLRVRNNGVTGYTAYDLETLSSEPIFSFDEIDPGELFFVTGPGRTAFSSDWTTAYFTATAGEAHPDPDLARDGSGVLVRRDIATGEQQTLMSFPTREDAAPSVLSFAVSPDDRRLAIVELADFATSKTIHVMPADGGPSSVVQHIELDGTQFGACPERILWTPDGRYVLHQRGKQPPHGPKPCLVYKISVENGEATLVGEMQDHRDWDLHPDGRRLVMGMGEARGEIWIMDGIGR